MPTVGNRLVREAVERAGAGYVARTLGISKELLDTFSSGKRPVNDTLLLKVIDLLDSLPQKQ